MCVVYPLEHVSELTSELVPEPRKRVSLHVCVRGSDPRLGNPFRDSEMPYTLKVRLGNPFRGSERVSEARFELPSSDPRWWPISGLFPRLGQL